LLKPLRVPDGESGEEQDAHGRRFLAQQGGHREEPRKDVGEGLSQQEHAGSHDESAAMVAWLWYTKIADRLTPINAA
jgi:hypothetical protein